MGYLTNAIKALFTRNTTNAASVSGARIPIVEQNGNPIGNDSMSNLAAVLGVKGKLDIVNKGSGSNAFAYDEAQGLMFCIQKDKAKWGLAFVATSGLGSGNVTWNKHDIITGELTFAYNSNGTIAPTNNTYDYAFYYLPIK